MKPLPAERIRQKLVDDAVAGHPALAREGLGHDIDPEMRLPAFPRACMSGMKMRLVVDPQLGRPQLPSDDLGDPIS